MNGKVRKEKNILTRLAAGEEEYCQSLRTSQTGTSRYTRTFQKTCPGTEIKAISIIGRICIQLQDDLPHQHFVINHLPSTCSRLFSSNNKAKQPFRFKILYGKKFQLVVNFRIHILPIVPSIINLMSGLCGGNPDIDFDCQYSHKLIV